MRRATCFVAVLAVIACAEPLEFADWTIQVPEGTRVIEYESVPIEERTARLEFRREFVLTKAFGTALYRPRSVAIAPGGEIFVLDGGNDRVVVFDAAGEALREFGRAGQGPGELQNPNAIGVAEGKVVIVDSLRRRINVFTTEGEHLTDHTLEERFSAREMVSFEEHVVALNAPNTPVPIRRGGQASLVTWAVGIYALDGTELARLVELEDTARARYLSESLAGQLPITVAHPKAALARDGFVYATAADQYQILAVEPSGIVRWALRDNSVPEPVAVVHKDEVVASVQQRLGESILEASWPETFATIANLEADGRGNLQVFPYVHDIYFETGLTRQPPQGPVPVDVYSSDGERLFTGITDIPTWDAQHGDRICRFEADPSPFPLGRLMRPEGRHRLCA